MKILTYVKTGAVLLALMAVFGTPGYATSGGAGDTTVAKNKAVSELLDSAQREFAAGEFDAASNTIERAIRISPRDASAWRLLSEVRKRQGRSAQAEALIAKAQSLTTDLGGLDSEPSIVTPESELPEDEWAVHRSPTHEIEYEPTWMDSRDALAQTLDDYEYSDWHAHGQDQLRDLREVRLEEEQAQVVYASRRGWKQAKREARAERKAAKREQRKARRAAKRQWQQERQAARHAWRDDRGSGRGRGPWNE